MSPKAAAEANVDKERSGGVVGDGGICDESERDTKTTPPKLVKTATNLTIVKASTRNIRPIPRVKNPLMLDNIVALATLV